jgi:capsular polysaccharide biosynthesis protein
VKLHSRLTIRIYRGQSLLIQATGTVKEDILEGAYVNLEVKYGYIKLINTVADLCKEIKNVELECPIEKGNISITKTVELPKEIPPVSPSFLFNTVMVLF